MRRVCVAFVFVVAWVIGWAARGDAVEGDELSAAAAAIDAHPDAPEGYDGYTQMAFRLKSWDDAIARLKVGVARIPSYHAGWYKLAYAYRQKHAFSDAAAAYRKFAELEPTRADTYFGLGAALQGAGDRDGAIAAYKRYLSMEKAPEKQKFIEQAKVEIARLDSAKPPVEPKPASPPTAPPSPEAQSLRARADRLHEAGKLTEAAPAYERALAADPGNLDLHVELGDVYFSQHRYADAMQVFKRAVDRDAGYALGWYNLAHAAARAGEQGTAAEAYRAYIRLRPSDPDPYYGLGQTLKATGDQRGAADAFRTYLKMEHRPESQRWIDKARHELEAIEGSSHASTGRSRDLKNPFDDHDAYASTEDLLPPGGDSANRERIARELASDDILPIDDGTGHARSADDVPTSGDERTLTSRDRLARYANALAAYRIALDRQAEVVGLLYERGAERVLANDLRGAKRAWSATLTPDRGVEEARSRLDKAREQLAATK